MANYGYKLTFLNHFCVHPWDWQFQIIAIFQNHFQRWHCWINGCRNTTVSCCFWQYIHITIYFNMYKKNVHICQFCWYFFHPGTLGQDESLWGTRGPLSDSRQRLGPSLRGDGQVSLSRIILVWLVTPVRNQWLLIVFVNILVNKYWIVTLITVSNLIGLVSPKNFIDILSFINPGFIRN